MATVTAAIMMIVGLIAIILMIVSVIYPEWFTHRDKSMAGIIAPVAGKKADEHNEDTE